MTTITSLNKYQQRVVELMSNVNFDATEEEVLPYFEKVENFIKDMEALITHK